MHVIVRERPIHHATICRAHKGIEPTHRHAHLQLHSHVYACDPTPQIPPRATVALKIPANCKSRVGNHPCEVGLAREATNRFYEVLVRVPVACEDGA
jgi:hypothetical protein